MCSIAFKYVRLVFDYMIPRNRRWNLENRAGKAYYIFAEHRQVDLETLLEISRLVIVFRTYPIHSNDLLVLCGSILREEQNYAKNDINNAIQ